MPDPDEQFHRAVATIAVREAKRAMVRAGIGCLALVALVAILLSVV